MEDRVYFDLYDDKYRRLFLKPQRYALIKKEIIDFLENERHLSTKTFARRVMFSQEIKANNQIEGYGDDVDLIKRIIERTKDIKDEKQRMRILNLYHGYHYILKTHSITSDTLKTLYGILSKDLLEKRDKARMGEYYRTAPVYILKQGRLDIDPYLGIDASKIDEFMDYYFNFLNEKINGDITDEYIKSQILHYYFVYIHPYFDVNGRTSRTMAMWYLLNKKAYPYIIFNRGIGFKGNEYDRMIERVRNTCDITDFISYMLFTVKLEFEKEHIMQVMSSLANDKLTALDYQSLLYFLTMNGQKTVLDFVTMYNRFNDKKRALEIFEKMIVPLLDKGILEIERETSKNIGDNQRNVLLKLRHTDEIDTDKIKRIKL